MFAHPSFNLSLEALSYTWGSPENPVNILVGHSEEEYFALSVTQNLAEALPYLRYEDKDRTMWIDAISINQEDLVERSKQVNHMARIYSKASQVVVWLGPEADDSTLALKTIYTLSTKIHYDQIRLALTATGEPSWADLNTLFPWSAQEWLAVDALFKRSWFERLWIWQEIRHAQNAVLKCGIYEIPWQSFTMAMNGIYSKKYPVDFGDFEGSSYRSRTLHVWHLCLDEDTDFLELATYTRQAKCADPRDRVFALVSLCSELYGRFQPDCAHSLSETFQRFFKEYVDLTFGVQLIRNCELHQDSTGLPSWVPNWSYNKASSGLEDAFASTVAIADVSFPCEGQMAVGGLHIATVEQVHPRKLIASPNHREIALAIQELAENLSLGTEDSSPGSHLELFCRTICINGFSDGAYPPTDILDFSKTMSILSELLQLQDADVTRYSSDVSRFLTEAAFQLVHRSFLIVKTVDSDPWNLVLGPGCAEKGDIITVLLGCASPMVLRPSDNGTYQVVGESYYQKFWAGEGLLGPLGEYEMVSKWFDSKGKYFYVWRDRRTGAWLEEDPRLGPLPNGWHKETDGKIPPTKEWFWNDENGSSEATWIDPRLTKKALLERGVALTTFTLV